MVNLSHHRSDVIKCLKEVSPEEILNKEVGVVSYPGLNYQPFVMTLDGKYLRMEPKLLLPRLALEMSNLKVLIGTNMNEGSKALMYFLPHFFPNQEISKPSLTSEDFDLIIRKLFHDARPGLVETIKFQYTNWTHPEDPQRRFENLVQLVGDWQYNCPVDLVTSSLKSSQIFKYLFEVRNPKDPWPTWTGVKNGDELDYIFGRPLANPDGFKTRDKYVSEILIGAWANFIKYG